MRTWQGAMTAGCAIVLAGCARHYAPEAASDPYGFLSGIWHGLVLPYALLTNVLSWLLSLAGFDVLSSIQIIGRPNTGLFFYYVGFAFGLLSYGAAGSR